MTSLHQVYARPGVSKIKGIGMIAIRNIPKGTILGKSSKPIKGKWHSLEWAYFNNIDKGVIDMMQDYICSKDFDIEYNIFVPETPLVEYHMQMLMNHSLHPNVEITQHDDMVSIKDISCGEELTEDYCCVCSPQYANSRVYMSKSI